MIEKLEFPMPPINKQEEKGLIEIREANFIIHLATSGNNRSSIQVGLTGIGDFVKSRLRKNRNLYEIFTLLSPQYTTKMQSLGYKMQNLLAKIKNIVEGDLANFQKHNHYFERMISIYDIDLERSKADLEQKRNTEKLRERQYHKVCYIPFLSQRFKKKYIRARDMSHFEEKRLAGISDGITDCQIQLIETAKYKSKAEREIKVLAEEYVETRNEYRKLDQTLQHLHEEVVYWRNFDGHQSYLVLKALDHITKVVLNTDISEPPYHALDVNNDWIEEFQVRWSEYNDAKKIGEGRWNKKSVDFKCFRCKVNHHGWPVLVKGLISTLQCTECYQKRRSSISQKRISQ